MAAEIKRTFRTLEEIRKKAAILVEEVNANPSLALAAATNPILALEELGYDISAQARSDLEDHARFGAEKAKKLQDLRARIFKLAGHPFELQSESELRRTLTGELKISLTEFPYSYQKEAEAPPAASLILPPQVRWAPKVADPLERLRGVHPIVEPLLEYRRLEATEPRLATRELYDAVRRGERRTPIVSLRAVMKAQRR